MQRREFITLLGGRAAHSPRAAAGQAADRGVSGLGYTFNPRPMVGRFVQRLRELSWVESRTIAIKVRWAEGRSGRFAEIAAEFVRLNLDVIVTSGAAILATKRATSVIPIVFAVAVDPLATGMVASLARPGGNATGLSLQSPDLAGKRVELLRGIFPRLRRLAVMGDAGSPAPVMEMGEVQMAAPPR